MSQSSRLSTQRAAFRACKVGFVDIDNNLLPTNQGFAVYTDTLTSALIQKVVVRDQAMSELALRAAIAHTRDKLNSIFFARRLEQIDALAAAYRSWDLELLFDEVTRETEAAYKRVMQLTPDIKAMLEALGARFRLIAYTGGSRAYSAQNFENAGLTQYFSRIYCGGPHPWEDSPQSGLVDSHLPSYSIMHELPHHAKRSLVGFTTILTKEGFGGEGCWMMGDHPKEDVLHAQAFNILGVLTRWYHKANVGEVQPDFVFESPGEVIQLLQ